VVSAVMDISIPKENHVRCNHGWGTQIDQRYLRQQEIQVPE
jgi:hypothetical protein